MTTPVAPGVPLLGEVVAGRYEIEGILGEGGTGIVLAARDLDLRGRVAVKVLLPEAFEQPGAGARFLREARATAALVGEHVVRILTVGTLEGGLPYMVMEHLSGADLRALLAERGSFPIDEGVGLILQACEALAEAHARGIIHRDIKPANLFVTTGPDGSPLVKVLDFGLSRLESLGGVRELRLTGTDLVIGSPQYMSPEQIRSLKYVDARTDVWALGVVLYVLLTGERPFDAGSFPAICARISHDTPASLRSLRPEIPAGLDALVLRCLVRSRHHRVQSVTELAQGLAPFGPTRVRLSPG